MNLRSVFRAIGLVLFLIAISMLLPVIVSLIYRDGDEIGMILAAATTAAISLVLILPNRGRTELDLKDGFAVVTFGWIAMSICATFPYLFTGQAPSLTDAFFESVSGLSTTGATIYSDIEGLPHGILFWRALTHWIGGMGIIVLTVAILPFLGIGGMQMFKAEAPGPTKDRLTPRIKDTAQLLWWIYAGLTGAEIILLMLAGMDWFDASCHAFATLATGGFSTKNTSVAWFNSAFVDWVIIVFMLLAGTSFTLHFHALRGNLREYWRSREFRFYLSINFLFSIAAALVLMFQGTHFLTALRLATFNVVSLGTATGFANADYELWPIFPQILIVIITVMGGMAGSTAGGMKSIRMYVIFQQARAELHRLVHPNTIQVVRVGNLPVPASISVNILAFFFLYMFMAVLGTLVMSAFGIDPITGLTASFACLSNAGPGLGNVGPADNYGQLPATVKWCLSFMMIAGRLEFFTVLVMLSKTYWRRT